MKTYYSNINNFKDSTQEMATAGFEERYASYLAHISDVRKKRLLRFKNEDDRLRSMAGTLLLTDILKKYSQGDVQDGSCPDLTNIVFPLNIESEESGKPYLPDAPDILFSISHSSSYAAVVIAGSKECSRIGIDIQAKDRKNILKIAKRFYTELENDLIASAESDSQKEELFYQIWSAKEAFIKCDGKGLSYGMSNFNADIVRDVVTDLDGNILARLEKQVCPEGYTCYVCRQ